MVLPLFLAQRAPGVGAFRAPLSAVSRLGKTRGLVRMKATEAPPTPAEAQSPEDVLPTMDELVSLCKRRGFIFPSSDIYNGFNGFYDYGPLGVEMKQNIKAQWWRT